MKKWDHDLNYIEPDPTSSHLRHIFVFMENRSLSTNYGILERITKLTLILMMGVSLSACSDTMSWKEEVLLHDGQIIISERHYNLGGYTGYESHNRSAIDVTVTFNLPNSKRITWKTDYSITEPEPNNLNLILFDVVKGVPYIATYPTGCIAYNKWKRPNPPQILFKYESEQWKRITLEEFPLELKEANVVVGKPDVRIVKSFYTVAQVKAANRDIKAPEYRSILREASKSKNSVLGCIELVLYKGKWIMPNDPVMRAIIDRESK